MKKFLKIFSDSANELKNVRCLAITGLFIAISMLIEGLSIDIGMAKVNFALNSSASSKKECFIVIKNKEDMSNHAQSMTRLKINVSFAVDFDF